jgi:hypothetical protein
MNEIIETKNKPRRTIIKEMTEQNCVRVYRSSPQDVILQIRRKNDIVQIALMFDEAKEIADKLLAAIAE